MFSFLEKKWFSFLCFGRRIHVVHTARTMYRGERNKIDVAASFFNSMTVFVIDVETTGATNLVAGYNAALDMLRNGDVDANINCRCLGMFTVARASMRTFLSLAHPLLVSRASFVGQILAFSGVRTSPFEWSAYSLIPVCGCKCRCTGRCVCVVPYAARSFHLHLYSISLDPSLAGF